MDTQEQNIQEQAGTEQSLNLPDDELETQTEGAEQRNEADDTGPAAGEQVGGENEEIPLDEKYQSLNTNYQRLERKFTRVSQELAEARELADAMRWIQQRPELAEQIQSLLDSYQGWPVQQYEPVDFAEIQRNTTEALRYLLGRPDFTKYEQDIRDFAEDEGFDPDDPIELKEAYRLWRGENAERLAQEQAFNMQQRGAQKQQARQKARLQGSGGPGSGPPPNFTKMSAQEVLAHEGLSLFTDE